jgi:hypothetical protein
VDGEEGGEGRGGEGKEEGGRGIAHLYLEHGGITILVVMLHFSA